MDTDMAHAPGNCPEPQTNSGTCLAKGYGGERGPVVEGLNLLAYPHSG